MLSSENATVCTASFSPSRSSIIVTFVCRAMIKQ